MDRALLVGHVQQTSNPVDGDRRRPTAQSSAPRQNRTAAAALPVRVHPVDLLVVQVGDEHVTGSAIDGDGAREKRALVATVRRRTPSPLYGPSVIGQTRYLSHISRFVLRIIHDFNATLAR